VVNGGAGPDDRGRRVRAGRGGSLREGSAGLQRQLGPWLLLGGGQSFGYATRQPDLGAAVVYYGVSPTWMPLGGPGPVLGLYGGTMPGERHGGARRSEMKELGKRS